MPRPRLPALLLCALFALARPAWAAPSAAAFDRLFLRIDDGDVPVDDEAQAARAVARLAALVPPGDARRARLQRTAACTLGFRHDSRGAVAYARRGIDEALRARDVPAQARFEFCRGLAFETFDVRAALAAYERGLAAGRRAEDAGLVGDGLVLRGGILSLQGRQSEALRDFLEAQETYDRARLMRRSEGNLLNIGIAYRRMGHFTPALAYLRESEAWARRLGRYPDAYSALMQQGYAHEEHGDGPAAVRTFDAALALATAAHSDAVDLGYAHLGLAHAWVAAGDAARARENVAHARRELAVDGTAAHEPMLDQADGLALAMQGRHPAAIAAFDRAEPLMVEQGNLRYLADLHRARAASREALGRGAAALADLRAYAGLAERLRQDADEQRVSLWRMRFDAQRRALEGARLERERRHREARIRALERERNWRAVALLLGLALAGLLAGLVVQQRREGRRLRRLALTDALTGLANRREILRLGQAAFADARRDGTPLAVVALDLDHFKRVNDVHGHGTGDAVLQGVARAFTAALRPGDRLGRSGGEEFLAVLPGADPARAAAIAERLRASLEPGVDGLRVRTSAGVAALQPADRRLQDLLARADAALYRAKDAGRDRVVAAG